MHKIDVTGKGYIVDKTRVPADCVTAGTSTSFDCSSLFVKTPPFPPAEYYGLNFIPTKNGFYINNVKSEQITLKTSDNSFKLSAIPRFVSKNSLYYLELENSTVLPLPLSHLSRHKEEQDLVLHFLTKADKIELFTDEEEFVPSVQRKIEQIKSAFSDLIKLHEASPEFRKLLYGSIAAVGLLIIIIITIISIIYCPAGTCCSCRRLTPPPPPPYSESGPSSHLLSGATAPRQEE